MLLLALLRNASQCFDAAVRRKEKEGDKAAFVVLMMYRLWKVWMHRCIVRRATLRVLIRL